MCAIAGLISRVPRVVPAIRGVAALLHHRGPDDEGYVLIGSDGPICLGGKDTPPEVYRADMPFRPVASLEQQPAETNAWLALGHRRLSILDLSPLGHQPMSYRDRYWIVYNGEVYNYLELRPELEAAGHQFHSRCDTEVILAAYAQWGKACFARFNGMWALAIYDAQQDELVLSRDRFGIKPLYYSATKDLFAFASEIKAFTCLPGWRPRVNGQATHDFLRSGLQDHSRETMFADVFQLEPGCLAQINCAQGRESTASPPGAGVTITRWYHLRPQPFGGSFEEAAAQFRESLIDSVKLRLRADVPVGSCLSGGLDSSSIVCATHRLLRAQTHTCAHKTFSDGSEIKRFDEREFIEKVVAVTGVEPHYVIPSWENLFKELDQVIWHQDEPFASTSIYAQWCVFKLAAGADIKVMLDVQGADESLCGYPNFRRAFLSGLMRSGHVATAWRESLAAHGTRSRALSGLWRAAVDAAIPVAAQRLFRQFRRNRRPPPWLAPGALGATFPGPLAARFQHHTSARDLSLELLSGAHLQMLLHWEDRNSMAHSIESRVPFLDYRLVEFVTGLPDRYKIRQSLTKAVLRESMSGLVPAEVLSRRDKMGFVTPEEVWVKQEGTDEFRRALHEALAVVRGVTPAASALLENVVAGRRDYDSAIWRIICLGVWMRRFKVGG